MISPLRFRNRLIRLFFIIKSILSGSKEYGPITIYGPDTFIQLAIKSLDLLKTKHPDAYKLVEQYIRSICLSKFSMVYVRSKRCLVGESCFSDSEIEYAGGLAHEAFHCKLYHEGLTEGVSAEEEEKKCIDYQCEVLMQLGASQDYIERLKEMLKTRYWEVPWEFQDW